MKRLFNMKFDYYTAPSNKVFNDIKQNAIKLWEIVGTNKYYIEEKTNRIKKMKNIKDNAWTIVAMFDYHNQVKLLSMLKKDTAELTLEAMRG